MSDNEKEEIRGELTTAYWMEMETVMNYVCDRGGRVLTSCARVAQSNGLKPSATVPHQLDQKAAASSGEPPIFGCP